MSVFYPQYKYNIITDITPEDLKNMGVLGIAVDIDNTTAYDNADILIEGVPEWVKLMQNSGIKICVLSNAYPERAEKIADMTGADFFVGYAIKPLPYGYLKAAHKLKLPLKKVAMIGDQLFTDISGANFLKMKSIYVSPIEKEIRSVKSFEFRRNMEKRIFEKQDKIIK